MSQYGHPAGGEGYQASGNEGVAGGPPQSAPPPGGHTKRRVYAKQQYDFNAGAAPSPYGSEIGGSSNGDIYGGAQGYGVGPGAGAPGIPGAPGVAGAGVGAPGGPGAVFTPGVGVTSPGAGVGGYGAGAYGAGTDGTGAGAAGSGYGIGAVADGLANQFGQLGLGGASGARGPQPVVGQPQGGQQPGANGQQQRLPLNQLYNIDLIQSLPPPITDLALPPPPLILPAGAAVNNNPEANASPDFIRSTLNVIPTNSSLLKKSKLPFALVVRPYTSLLDASAPVPIVSDTVICRCRRCRCYINPFVTFMDQSHRWKCNMCGLTNEVPTQFDWDPIKNERQDRYARNEINYGVVEFVAPPEYLVRPPQPPIYVFVLDVSVNAIANGLLATAARTILESLDRLPNSDGRTRVAFIAVDAALHYFSIPLPSSQQKEPSIMVVSDLENPFLPLPSGLLVNLNECRPAIEQLLGTLGETFAGNVSSSNALGSALKAANQLIGNVGGKIICLTASIPNVGIAKLEIREDRKVLGTAKEGALLQTANAFYKSFAVECNRSQVTVDMFLFSSQYQDVASLSNLPRYTGGQTYFYPGWSANRAEDAVKFAHEFGEHLSQEFAMEAVLRVRASTGLRMNAFYGNFFNRSSDLCSFPTFPRDQSYVIEVAIDETINKPYVCFQAAVLHTTCHGERRIRVLNVAIPTSNLLQDIYASADQLAITAYYTHKAVEKALTSGIQDAQDLLTNKLTEMLQTYKKDLMTTNVGASAPLQFCANLRMLPLLFNGLLKHVGLRKSAQIPSDLRSAALALLSTLPLKYLIKYIHADFYSLHDMPDEAGVPNEETGELVFPPKLNLTGERIVSHGLYLIDDGQVQFLWVGRDAVPQLLLDAFGVDSSAQVKPGKRELPEVEGSLLNAKIRSIIAKTREKNDSITWPSLFIMKEDGDPSLRLWATTFLIEDRSDQSPSYFQFLSGLRDKINS
ncbi:COPII subunit SEC24 [Sugiyamaella lignohabitans]|uniref:COPII subunit SEC24 n=1 Tax=Sugiyamaella lignohabitans TaxID=796027 RepID=A0A167D6P5_9ASCO|nr:COPII subunit SEC24 [Sugiyamaella lignohabitans]ANB12546.1 COPII subunit SEC24 [Sugiyamaella lignohabitans]